MANKIQQGSFGRVRVFEDFLAPDSALTWSTSPQRLGQVGQVSVNEGSFAHVVDEPGGILSITCDNADDDNCALYAGPFKAADGGCVMEARFKRPSSVALNAVFCGFSETLDATTPVMPAEFSGTTLDFVATGNVVGMLDDSDATTADWRACFGNDNVVISTTDANGTRAYEASVADEWDVVRVEIGADGDAYCYLNGRLIKSCKDAVTTTDIVHAVLMVECRGTASQVMEVDYFYAEGGRDWTDS
jgi:hypothetical protein